MLKKNKNRVRIFLQDTVQEGLELTFDGNFDTSCPSGDRLRLGCELKIDLF